MKLRTLKEFIFTQCGSSTNETVITGMYLTYQKGEIRQYCYPEKLREEAIKWILKLQSDHPYEGKDRIFSMDQYIKGQVDWIKMFFNISDEEVQNVNQNNKKALH